MGVLRFLLLGLAGALLVGLPLVAFMVFQAGSVSELTRRVERRLFPRTFSTDGRLVAYPGRQSTACPEQDTETGVILALGQSNAANHASDRRVTRYPSRVFNYHQGQCYVAASPLLGASGDEGEFLTSLADRLVESSTYRKVVIVAQALGGSPIAQWRAGGDLNSVLRETLSDLAGRYRVTDVVWVQGETDHSNATPFEEYTASFGSLVETLRAGGVKAPIFIAIATRCYGAWNKDNPTANSQRDLLNRTDVRLGADTDSLLQSDDRRDGCHYNASGQDKVAAAFAAAIARDRPLR